MNGYRLYRIDTNSSLDVAKAVKLELVDLSQGIGILPIVLNDVDVIGDCEQAGEGGCLGVPERGGDDAALDEDVQALLDEEGGVEDDEAVAEREHVVAGAHFEEGADCTLLHFC